MNKKIENFLEKLSKFAFKSKEEIYPTKNPEESFDEIEFSSVKTRTVYRFCTEQELNAIENKNKDNLGNYFNSYPKQPSTHKYQPGVRYLHFFDNKDDSKESLRDLQDDKAYLCSFNIETSILKEHKGFGYYSSHGYDSDYIKVKEYAIPVKEFDINSFCDGISIKDLYTKQEDNSPNENVTGSIESIEEVLTQN